LQAADQVSAATLKAGDILLPVHAVVLAPQWCIPLVEMNLLDAASALPAFPHCFSAALQ
jgi:hypothetical protein